MRFKQILTVVLIVVTAFLAGCNRNPEVAKRKYLDSGNRYFSRGKYKEARIMYLDALQKDQRFGPAHYRLALTALKLGSLRDAVAGFRRAIELLPESENDKWDSMVKLSEIYLLVAREQKQFLDEVEENTKKLLKRDPNSFDGHRLTGDLLMARAAQAASTAHREDALALMKQSVEEYETANRLKANEEGVLMQLARANATLGEFAKSEALYKKVIDNNKALEAAYSELYKLYVIQRKLADGEQTLKSAFQANPKAFGFLTTLALHYSLTGRHDDMVAVLQQVKSRANEFEQAYLVVGDFYLRIGDGDTAIREYKEGITKDPKKKMSYQKRIIEVYMRQGRRNEAADLNAQILKDDPNDNDAKGLSATFLLDKGDVARAITELQSVVTRSPENPVAHYQLGRAHAARGEYEQARQQFQKAIDLRPDYIVARLGLAQLQVTRGEFDAALKTAEQVLQIDRNSVNARLIESAALMGQRKFGDSREMLGGMLRQTPNSPDVYFQIGLVNLAENKYKDAEDAFRKTHQLNPTNPRGLMGVVETQMAQNKPDEALKMLRSESDKNPNNIDLRLAIGNIAVRAGKYDDALQAFNQILNSLDKNSKARGDIFLRIGETYRRKGDDAGAVSVLQKAREVLPDNVTVLSTLALTLDHAGRWSEAKQIYEATLKLDANSGIPLNNLAYLIAEHNGDLDDALTKATKAKQLLPNTFEVADTLGWIYLKKNLSDNAIEIFRDLTQKAPNHSTFRYHLGMALYQKGDRPRAIKELQEAMKFNPPKDEKEKIQQLLQKLNGI
jgi:tetratricopeptide (TPR) repeat protein